MVGNKNLLAYSVYLFLVLIVFGCTNEERVYIEFCNKKTYQVKYYKSLSIPLNDDKTIASFNNGTNWHNDFNVKGEVTSSEEYPMYLKYMDSYVILYSIKYIMGSSTRRKEFPIFYLVDLKSDKDRSFKSLKKMNDFLNQNIALEDFEHDTNYWYDYLNINRCLPWLE